MTSVACATIFGSASGGRAWVSLRRQITCCDVFVAMTSVKLFPITVIL